MQEARTEINKIQPITAPLFSQLCMLMTFFRLWLDGCHDAWFVDSLNHNKPAIIALLNSISFSAIAKWILNRVSEICKMSEAFVRVLNAHTNDTEAVSWLWEALVCPMLMTRTITTPTRARTPGRGQWNQRWERVDWDWYVFPWARQCARNWWNGRRPILHVEGHCIVRISQSGRIMSTERLTSALKLLPSDCYWVSHSRKLTNANGERLTPPQRIVMQIIRYFPGSRTGQWSINSTVPLVMFTTSGPA